MHLLNHSIYLKIRLPYKKFRYARNCYSYILLSYGGAQKSTFEMTEAELKKVAESILQRANEKSFSKGLPIYFSKDEKVFVEYPDGQFEEITKRA